MSDTPPASDVRSEWLGRLNELAAPGATILIARAQAPHDPVRVLAWAMSPDRSPTLIDDVLLPREGEAHVLESVLVQAGQELWRDVREAGCDAWAQGHPTYVWTNAGPFQLFREGKCVASVNRWRMLTIAQTSGDAYVKLASIEVIEVCGDDDGVVVRTVQQDSGTRTLAWWPRAAEVGPFDADLDTGPAIDLAHAIARAASVEVRVRDERGPG